MRENGSLPLENQAKLGFIFVTFWLRMFEVCVFHMYTYIYTIQIFYIQTGYGTSNIAGKFSYP